MKCGKCLYYYNGWFGLGKRCEKKKKLFYFSKKSIEKDVKKINQFNFLIDIFCRSFKVDPEKPKKYLIESAVSK